MKTIFRILFVSILFCAAVALTILSAVAPELRQPRPLKLAAERPQLRSNPVLSSGGLTPMPQRLDVPFVPGTPTFGHPVISGIGGTGFEEDLAAGSIKSKSPLYKRSRARFRRIQVGFGDLSTVAAPSSGYRMLPRWKAKWRRRVAVAAILSSEWTLWVDSISAI